jgi:hypothetical protein
MFPRILTISFTIRILEFESRRRSRSRGPGFAFTKPKTVLVFVKGVRELISKRLETDHQQVEQEMPVGKIVVGLNTSAFNRNIMA